MITKVAFQKLRRMSVLSLLVAVNAVMLLSCRADAQQNIKRINMEKENLKEIYLAGGCFWGAEHYFKQIDGVVDTEVGFANGTTANPTYKEVCTDKTGFAETVHVTYDSAKVSLKFLLEMYFKAIDPTSINRQGHDTGTQYRTGVYYTDKDGNLTIKMEHKDEKKDENKKEHYLRREFSYSNYEQALTLPEDVEKDKIEAKVNNGVLHITLPRTQKAEKETKRIEVA